MVVPAQTSEVQSPSGSSGGAIDEQTSFQPLPLTPLEAFLLQCDTPQSSMVIRVILRLSGECQTDLCVETMQRAIKRHPLLCCRVQTIDRKLCWVQGEVDPTLVSRQHGSIFESESGPMNKSIDLTQSAGLQTSIIVKDDGIKVILDAHHATLDGNAIVKMIADWFHLYHCEVTDSPPKLRVVDSERLHIRDQFPERPSIAPLSLKDAIRNFLVTIRGRSARWAASHPKHRMAQESVGSHCSEVILSVTQAAQLRERLAAWKVNLNDLVLVCCMNTFARLAPPGAMNHRITVLNPVDLRLPSDRALSAANRFGFAFVRRMRSECLDPVAILQGVHDEMRYVRSNFIGVEFLKGLATASRIPGGIALFRRLGLFIPSLQWTCLGDITRGFRRLVPWQDGFPVAGKLRFESLTGFAPHAEHVPVSITTCETNQRMVLTVRASPKFLTMDQTSKFAADLVELLCSFDLPQEKCGSSDRGDSP